ncbi:MAG: hypothetical protein M3Z23_01790 [Acidobacteriota bacterium]|nr:hypothetical protein [Acidobacteriota bacterium]
MSVFYYPFACDQMYRAFMKPTTVMQSLVPFPRAVSFAKRHKSIQQMRHSIELFCLFLLATAIAGAAPPFGTWKLNLEKSRFEPGPAPKSFTLTFVPAENGAYRVTASGETSDGAPIETTYLLKEDGKDYPVTKAPFDSIAITNEKPNISLITMKQQGKVFERTRSVVSGKLMTNTSDGLDVSGKRFHAVEVLERQ